MTARDRLLWGATVLAALAVGAIVAWARADPGPDLSSCRIIESAVEVTIRCPKPATV